MQRAIVVYGTDHCADCHRARSLMDRHGIKYEYRNIASSAADKEAMLALTHGRNVIPTIVWDNVLLQEPSNETLLHSLGLKGDGDGQD